MMLKVRDQSPEPEEQTIEFWLERDGDGDVVLRARDLGRSDDSVLILFISPRGVCRYMDMGIRRLGLPCDDKHRIARTADD